MKIFGRLVTAVAVLSVCLVGCGGDDNPSGGGGVFYESVKIGSQTWMKKNLNIETEDSWCYENRADNCNRHGRLYTWESAKTVCPSGWRLPDIIEWRTLVAKSGGSSAAAGALKSKNAWASSSGISSTDAYGFSAMPGGYRGTNGSFGGTGLTGRWWTATEVTGGNACLFYMQYNRDNVDESFDSKGFGLSVRCVKDE